MPEQREQPLADGGQGLLGRGERLTGEEMPRQAQAGAHLDGRSRNVGDKERRQGQQARRQIAGVDGTIRSFLALAAGGGAEEELDLRALAEDVALAALQEARGRVRVSVAPGGAARLRGVAPELKAALHALVVNAVEASPDGGEVVVAVEPRDEGGAAVTVEDEGPGLPEEVRARLFTPHVTTKPSGSGMGLFLAHRIATTRYGGSLALEARAERGTRALLAVGPRGGGARA